LKDDWEVNFAKEVLLSATSSRRADVFVGAASVVAHHNAAENEVIQSAFRDVNVDWSQDANAREQAESELDVSQLTVVLDLGEDNAVVAGEEEDVVIEITNNGTHSVNQLSLTTLSDNPAWNYREFYFGKIAPNATVRAQHRVVVPRGYSDEVVSLELVLRSPDNPELATQNKLIRTVSQPLPRLSYTMRLYDDGSGDSVGDGDGIAEVGETIEIELEVQNEGFGGTGDAFARLTNRSGSSADLRVGVIEIGTLVDGTGDPCESGQEDCYPVLEPGGSHVGRFSFEVVESGPLEWELRIGDNRAFDYATISIGGFTDYFQFIEKFTLSSDQSLSDHRRAAPTIEITRGPDVTSAVGDIVISGVVRDDEDIRDVMVFHDDNKVYYRRGSAGGASLPFSVEQALQPGLNTFYVLARDRQGLSTTTAISTWLNPDMTPQAANPRMSTEGG